MEDKKNKDKDKMEENRARFEKIAPPRVQNALKQIRLVSNLLNRNNYEYEDKEFDEILTEIRKELQLLSSKHEAQKRGKKGKWTLK
jgi:light-regulated signal transduction histidine kinase (bacteriophytochrome)